MTYKIRKWGIISLFLLFSLTIFSENVYAVPKLSKEKITIKTGNVYVLRLEGNESEVKWTSSKKKVASIIYGSENEAIIYAAGKGKSKITAEIDKKKYTCSVTVKKDSAFPSKKTILAGQKLVLKRTQKAKWSISDNKVLKLSSKSGKKTTVRALEKGKCLVTAKIKNKTKVCRVKVIADPRLENKKEEEKEKSRLLYMGRASIRITTPEGKVIYIDPYAGTGYDLAADLILVTHAHYDHNDIEKVSNRNPGCQIITWEDALKDGIHQVFSLDYVTVEAVEAGYNKNHDVTKCVGYILTLSDGVSVYVTGDTSKTKQMPNLAEKEIDYAFYCCDGVYNMDMDEAAECAGLVKAKHNIPYHISADVDGPFDMARAELFQADNRMIIEYGTEIELEK